jgi:hypothetical protein
LLRFSRVGLVASLPVLSGGCGDVEVPEQGVPDLVSAIEADPAIEESFLDGCVRVYHVWKIQARVVHTTARDGPRARARMLVDSARTPFSDFWDGYVSSGFERWARRQLDVANDPRSEIPVQVDVADLIADIAIAVEQATGRRGCSDWYLVYGPGWANLGGLGTGEMLIDFFGLAREGGAEEVRTWLPHEFAHVIHGSRGPDPGRGTLLSAIISEGFASYFAYRYWDGAITPAQSLGFDESEWEWALQNEAELWALVSQELGTEDDDLIDSYRSRSQRVMPGAPSAIGYFLGYRITERFVAQNGLDSYLDIFDLPVEQVLQQSQYPAARESPDPASGPNG